MMNSKSEIVNMTYDVLYKVKGMRTRYGLSFSVIFSESERKIRY